MSNNIIQIKRSATAAAPTTLNAGELAYSNSTGGSGVLYIGSTDGGSVVPIGGVRNPGTLTANQALVANSTSGINQIITSNVTTQYISANGSYGTAGYVLASGGTTTNAYWISTGSFNTNVAAQYAWTNTQSFSNTITFTGSILGNTINATSITIGTAFTANSQNLVFTGTSITATSANASLQNLVISGNLTVQGTTTTIDTTNLTIKDNFAQFADQQASTTTFTDLADVGIYSASGNTLNTLYSGLGRIAASSTNTNPFFKLFSTTISPNNTILDTGATTGSLQAYLLPYGIGGAFVANSTVVNITASGSVSSAIVANSITLTTALAANYGGTGQSSYTTGDLLYASASTTLSKLSVPGAAANGQVLQIINNLPAYGSLDGGIF
jgi:hypothetical protein